MAPLLDTAAQSKPAEAVEALRSATARAMKMVKRMLTSRLEKNVTDVEKRPVFLVLDSRVLRQKNEPNSMSLVTV